MGLFWDASEAPKRRKPRPRPPIPDNKWSKPKDFPRLDNAKVLSVDVETYDPGLLERGPGWARNEGHIVGIAIGADHDGRWYFPIRHTVCRRDNLDPTKVLAWAKSVLESTKPKVGANLLYDVGWLSEEGITVGGDLYDVQFAEALLTENSPVNLDHLGEKYLDLGKTSDTLYQWLSEAYGGTIGGKQRANIYRAPPSLVGPYAESDVDLPLRVLKEQAPLLKAQGLWRLFRRENALIPLLIAMRRRGVRVDINKAEQVYEQLTDTLQLEQRKLDDIVGGTNTINVNASRSIVTAFDKLSIPYPQTRKGSPSFTKAFLQSCKHPIATSIVRIRNTNKLRNDFVKAAILEHSVNGRIHCQFHPLRNDDYGARSGRFSSSDPNLQQIPSRDLILAPLIRGLFVPDEGHKQWRKQDSSQIEYRGLAHFSVGEGADALRRSYIDNPRLSYHKYTQRLIEQVTGMLIEYSHTKNINFGIIYGMGKTALAGNLGISQTKANSLFETYHQGAPYAKATMDHFATIAQQHGFVETITGRRSRFNLYEPAFRDYDEDRAPALPYDKALRAYGSMIKRAMTHKALNRVLQGSAADLMKETMLQCWESGLYNVTGVPLLTVHDEQDFSDPGNCEEAFSEIKRISETAIDFAVPLITDEDIGPDWGHLKEQAA